MNGQANFISCYKRTSLESLFRFFWVREKSLHPLPHQLMGEGYSPLPSSSDGASKAVYPFPFVASYFRRRVASPTVPRCI